MYPPRVSVVEENVKKEQQITTQKDEVFMYARIVSTVLGISLLLAGCSTKKSDFEVAPEHLTASVTAKVSSLNRQNFL